MCLDAAAHAAEAATLPIAALLVNVEAAVRQISIHAEMTFGHLQNTSNAAQLIGQQADQAIEALADARHTAEHALMGGQMYVIPSIWVYFLHSHIS